MGHQLPRLRILPRRRDLQLPLALQNLERVRRPRRALLFDDGQHLVRQLGLAHVKERLPRHRRVLHPLLLRHKRQYRLHQ
jgi:hypothetical protein